MDTLDIARSRSHDHTVEGPRFGGNGKLEIQGMAPGADMAEQAVFTLRDARLAAQRHDQERAAAAAP